MADPISPGGPSRPPTRTRIRLAREVYAHPGEVFLITICTAKRRRLFDRPGPGRLVFNALLTGKLFTEAQCHATCLMPDHLHLLVSPRESNLIALINGWKSYTTNLLHSAGSKGPVWQRSFYDHALRSEESVNDAAQYVVENPVRKGLVTDWIAYPYVWAYWVHGV
ncbi:MAG: transposase [Armatimonadota bacterium]